jgi:hypothetical protein
VRLTHRTLLTFLLTYLLTPRNRVLLEKLTCSQLVKKFPIFYVTRKFITAFTNARHLSLSPSISPGPTLSVWTFRNKICFYGESLLKPRPTPKLEDHPLSAVRHWLFHIFAATFHTGGRSSSHNLLTRHDVVTGTHLSRYRTLGLQTILFFLYAEISWSTLCIWNIFIHLL